MSKQKNKKNWWQRAASPHWRHTMWHFPPSPQGSPKVFIWVLLNSLMCTLALVITIQLPPALKNPKVVTGSEIIVSVIWPSEGSFKEQ